MTRQYLLGELSLILGELQRVTTNEATVREVAWLRQEAETTSPAALGPVVARALKLIDRLCWDDLSGGETDAFIRELAIWAELWEFGDCAGLLKEGRMNNELRHG